MDADEQAIRDLIATWLRASKARDHETVLRLMDPDVVFLTPGNPPMRGRAGFAEAQAAQAGIQFDATADIREVRVFGDFAYCWTFLTVVATPPGGAPVKREGNVLSVLHRQDGNWTIFRDANLLAPAS